MAHQIWESEDKKKQGTLAEIERYEEGLKNPLSRMRFPYRVFGYGYIQAADSVMLSAGEEYLLERTALVAFANLAPLIAEWIADNKWEQMHPQMPGNRNLWEGYKAAAALISKP